MNRPPVTLIVLNWNARPYLPACLDSLRRQDYPHVDVVLVDNGSSDGSAALVQAEYPWVKLVASEVNSGFAGGNNLGIALAKTPYVVLLNPDVRIEQTDWLTRLLAPMVADPTIGIAGCKIFFGDGKTLQHAGGFITKPQGLPGHRGYGLPDSGQFEAPCDADYVIGAAMAIRMSLVEEIGALDDGYFLYYEDADYCQRARAAGYRVVYLPEPELVHFESVTTQKGSPFYFQHMHASRWRYLLKFGAPADLLHAAAPVERTWLATRGANELLGLARAYLHALRQMPAIWLSRQETDPAYSLESFRQISALLVELRQAVFTPGQSSNIVATRER